MGGGVSRQYDPFGSTAPLFDQYIELYKESGDKLISFLQDQFNSGNFSPFTANDEGFCLVEIMAELGGEKGTKVLEYLIDNHLPKNPKEGSLEANLYSGIKSSALSALHIAAAKDNKQMCEYLLGKFGDFLEEKIPELEMYMFKKKDYKLNADYTPLMTAVKAGSVECFDFLLFDKGANPNMVLNSKHRDDLLKGKEAFEEKLITQKEIFEGKVNENMGKLEANYSPSSNVSSGKDSVEVTNLYDKESGKNGNNKDTGFNFNI